MEDVMQLPFCGDLYLEKSFINLKKRHNIEVVIETGAYHGVTTEWLALNFDKVVSFELMRKYHTIASKRMVPYDNASVFLGDSAKGIQSILHHKELKNKNILFFLDAHWYQNPLREELRSISSAGIKPIIAIHDMYNPVDPSMGYDEYPGISYTYQAIKPRLDAIYGLDAYRVGFNAQAVGARRGCMFVEPIGS